jgi:hypothetical protein
MSKQDIEKRLGFAAQGVKETTRTSAKAAFASPKYRAFVYRGSPSNNVLVKATEFMDSASAAEDAAKQIVMSFRGKPGYSSNNYFADIAQETPEGAKTVKNYIRFSRPGVKAKFADAALERIRKNAAISNKLLTLVAKGMPVPEAFDLLFGEGAYKKLASDVYDELRKDKSSRPGAKASFEKEYVLWGLPKGETDRLHEKVLSTQAKTPAQMEDVKKRAAAAGWHSFRVQILDLSKPYKGFARSGAKAKMETPMRVALTPMHTRAEQGYENFIAVLMKFGGITREQAQKAFKAFKDAKVLVTKEQYMGGGITVKHGAFMERDVIRRAAGLPEESPRPGVKAKMAAEIASDPRDKDFEKLKTLKGVVHQGKGFYIIPNKLMTPERRTKVKRSTQRYELSNMGDLVGWGTNHPNVNDYRLKDWAEAFA